MTAAGPSHRGLAVAAIVVFTIAISARLSSCYESFWVDELHSAWCIWDSFGDVAPRANVGHQSPFYFYGLWFWRQFVGDSELALRTSSVLAVAVAASVITLSVSLWTKSCIAGVVAGLVIALESNSLFFGTELRPYAFVMLFMSIATACFVRLLDASSRHDDRLAWMGLGTSTLLMTLCHPTSLGVALWLILVLGSRWWVQDRAGLLKINLIDLCLAASCAAVGLALWNTILAETWQQRGSWRSFAQANRLGQLWGIWDWTYLLLVPLTIAVVAMALGNKTRERRSALGSVACLAVVCVASTGVFWLASKTGWVHLWHRRYFVAVLPVFAFVVGGSLSMEHVSILVAKWLRPAAGCAILLGLLVSQGLFAKLDRYPPVLVRRGEDWRGAMEYVRSEKKQDDQLRVDAGLIEAREWCVPSVGPPDAWRDVTPEQSKLRVAYLAFPVSGPYKVDADYENGMQRQEFRDRSRLFLDPAWDVISRSEKYYLTLDAQGRQRNSLVSTRRWLILTRRPASKIDLSRFQAIASLDLDAANIRSFGGVSVVELPRVVRAGD